MRFEIEPDPSFEPAELIRFLARRAVPGVEEVEAGAYRRSIRVGGLRHVIELRPARRRLEVRVHGRGAHDRSRVEASVRALFDLDADTEGVTGALGDDPLLGPLVRASPGRRVPGTVDPDELAIRAVIGQQVSLRAAATVAGRLVAAHGEPLREPVGAVTHLFPTPAALAAIDPRELPMPRSRGRGLTGMAAALAAGEIVLDPSADAAAIRRKLLALPGIGAWTASYVEMRGLGDPDAFLASDLGVRQALERLGEDGSPGSAAALAERWRPYRAYALQHLWSTHN